MILFLWTRQRGSTFISCRRFCAFWRPDGMLVSDNVLQDGDVIESRFAVTRRNRTIHKRMREYLYTLTHSEELVTAVLPVGDGITLSTRR